MAYHFHERRVAVFPDYLRLSLRLLVRIRPKVDLQREEMERVIQLIQSSVIMTTGIVTNCLLWFFFNHRGPKWQFYIVKSSVIVTFPFCDYFSDPDSVTIITENDCT